MSTIFDEFTDDSLLNGINFLASESVFNDVNDIFYNKVRYENSDINLLFIVGYSGGGKSTLSNSEKKIGREVVDMDKIVLGSSKSLDYFKSMGNFAFSFMSGPGKKYHIEGDENKEKARNQSDMYRKDISRDLIKYAKSYASSHNSTRLVMEGVWIYRYIEPSDIDSYAVYIKGTSLKTSTERAIKRDMRTMTGEHVPKSVQILKSVGKVLNNIKDILLGNLEKYQKYFGPKAEAQKGDKISVKKKIANAIERKKQDIENTIDEARKKVVYGETEEIKRSDDMANTIIEEKSTEKKVLDRDAAVGEIDKKIRETNSSDKKEDLEKEKKSKDKEINSEKKDEKDSKKEPVKESYSIRKYENIIEKNNERLSEIMESASSHQNEINGLLDEIENAEKYLAITRMQETAELVNDMLYDEATNMEDEIKPIVDKLNSKGYKVKYASPGHRKLRKKEDNEPDGVYYGKLYSDARVMFDKKYKFTAPKYWMHRDVDGCSYLDIIPIKYDKKDGSPDEAFAKWKDNYMDSLRAFASDAKDDSDEKEDEVKTESVSELIALGTIIGVGLVKVAVDMYKKAKLKKKWKLRMEAMHVYPKKHKDCPDISKLKRSKHQMSAFDGSKGKQVADNDDNAPGNYIYTYTIEGKPVVVVVKEGTRFTSGAAKNVPEKFKPHIMYIYSYIMIFKHGWITPKIEKWLDDEITENEKLKKQNGGKILDNSEHLKVSKDIGVESPEKNGNEVKESEEDLNDLYSSVSYMDNTLDDLLKQNGID